MSKPLKIVFETRLKEGDDVPKVKLAALPPSAAIRQHGRLVHAKSYNDAVQAGAMLREELEGHLRKSKLWDDERQTEYDRLRKVLLDGEKRLAKGGMRLTEARRLAIDMSKARLDLQELLSQRNRVDANTADAIADQAQFNYFVANCTVYNDTGKPVFTTDGEHANTDNYVERGTDQAAIDAATKLSELMFGSEKDMLTKLPENVFLKRFNFMDDEFHLINKVGHKVDEKGRLVDNDGRYIDEKGEFVDADGNRVDKEGRYVFDESPFLDDDDQPIGAELPAPVPVPSTGQTTQTGDGELVAVGVAAEMIGGFNEFETDDDR